MIYPRSQQTQERGLWTPNSVFTASPQKKNTKNKKTRHTNTRTHTHKPGQGRSPQPSFSHLFGTRTGRFQNKSPILRDLHIPPQQQQYPFSTKRRLYFISVKLNILTGHSNNTCPLFYQDQLLTQGQCSSLFRFKVTFSQPSPIEATSQDKRKYLNSWAHKVTVSCCYCHCTYNTLITDTAFLVSNLSFG